MSLQASGAEVPYDKADIFLNVEADKLNLLAKSFGNMIDIGEVQSLVVISESKVNKFNGTGIGMYATGNGEKSKNKAIFDWFEYKY